MAPPFLSIDASTFLGAPRAWGRRLASVCLVAVVVATAMVGAGSSAEAQTAPEDSVFEWSAGGSELERLQTMLGELTAMGRDPAWVGLLYDNAKDPDLLRPTWYVIRPDSAVWVRTPEGESVVLDPYVATRLGGRVGEATGYADAQAEGFGWGWYGGRFHLYASRGFEPTVALALAGLIIAVVLGSLGWLVWALRRSRAQAHTLAESRRLLAEAREGERLRVAREIHDGPVQDLHALRLRIGSPSGLLAEPVDQEVLAVIGGLRAISENLRPPTLDAMGLDVAVHSFIGRFERTYPDIRTDVVVEGEAPPLDATVALTLFRVVQEAMNNAAQHGAPGDISVRLVYGPETLRVVVEDDGAGFDVPAVVGAPQAAADGHYGLIGMAERAEAVGGAVRLSRRVPSGIRVEFSVPRALSLADPVQTS